VKLKYALTTIMLTVASATAAQAGGEQTCAGILHLDRDSLRFGGGKGETEGICIINKSEERKKVLAACSPGHHCRIKGIVEDCKDSGECSEMTHVISVQRN
jgi:hypothetical protein